MGSGPEASRSSAVAPTVPDVGPMPAPSRGAMLDRFLVLEPLGSGGMGVVLAAFDPELDRKVALKLLRSDRLLGEVTTGSSRLVAEAKAMARLQHANVVAVHEIGVAEGRVFVVMEHVDGTTLRTWLEARPRSWREGLEMLLGAGEGLAAAHRAGIVHRDFKPENVLVDGDGRPRVADFGLASALTADYPTGPVAGTVPYMPPEQLRGEPAGEEADQFAFAVAVWEALWGERPFSGGTPAARVAAIEAGPAEPRDRRGVPAAVRAALLRALAPDPAARWPSLDALLAELRRAVARRRWVAPAIGLAAVVTAALASAAFVAGRRQQAGPACDGGAALAAATWDPAARARVERAFAASGAPHAGDAFARVDAALRARLDGWAAAHREACEATHLRHEQSPALLDLRMTCLGRLRDETGALVALLGAADRRAVVKAVPAVESLGDPATCADVAALTAVVPPPRDPEIARQILDVGLETARVRVLGYLGRIQEQLDAAHALAARARVIGYPPALEDALAIVQRAEGENGNAEHAIEIGWERVAAAELAHDERGATDALAMLGFITGIRAGRYAEAAVLLRFAEAKLARAGSPPMQSYVVLSSEAQLLSVRGQHAAALPRFGLSLALCSQVYGPESSWTALELAEVASELSALGAHGQARATGERALALFERSLGAEHPTTLGQLVNLGAIEQRAHDLDGAITYYQRALPGYEAAYGAEHPMVALLLQDEAEAYREQHRFAEARPLIERAVRIREQALGADHPSLAMPLGVLGAVQFDQGEQEAGLATLERALAIARKKYGDDSPELADWYAALAQARRAHGEEAAARAAEAARDRVRPPRPR